MTPTGLVRSGKDVAADLAFLTRALKAPALRDSAARLAERARTEAWSHEEYLAACLQREVAARDAHGGEGRIRAARFPGRKTLEEFDFDHARGLKRDFVLLTPYLGLGDSRQAPTTVRPDDLGSPYVGGDWQSGNGRGRPREEGGGLAGCRVSMGGAVA